MNLYAYVFNDPVNGTDPTGLICQIHVIGIFKTTDWGPVKPGQPAPSGERELVRKDVTKDGCDDAPATGTSKQNARGQCVGQRFASFFEDNFEPAAAMARSLGISVILPLGLAAHESGYGDSPQYRGQFNPFGSTPGGGTSPGLTYRSFGDAWAWWGSYWGPRVNGGGDSATRFLGSLAQDHQKTGGVDSHGPYNTQVAPRGDPGWKAKVLDAMEGVLSRLPRWLRSRC
jgi:hypothetical protein